MPLKITDYKTTIYDKRARLTLVFNTLYIPLPAFYFCDRDMMLTYGKLLFMVRFMKPGEKLKRDNILYEIEIERVDHKRDQRS